MFGLKSIKFKHEKIDHSQKLPMAEIHEYLSMLKTT